MTGTNEKRCVLSFEQNQEELLIFIKGEIDHYGAVAVRGRIDEKINELRPRSAVLVLSGIDFMDSSGIGLIIGRSEVCTELGASIRLKGLSERNKKLLRLSGIEKITNLTISDV